MHTTKLLQMIKEILLLTIVVLYACMGATEEEQEKNRTETVTKSPSQPINKEYPKERTVIGQVVDPNGQPLAQIQIVTYGYHKREIVTGQDGRFTFKLPFKYQHEAGCLIVARDRKQNLATFHGYAGQENCIVMKLEPAVVLAGKVCDSQGNGIKNARFRLFWRFPKAGVSYGKWEDVTIDKKGQFEIRAIPYGRRYLIEIIAQGYGVGEIGSINTDIKDVRIQLPTIVLQTADQSVGGIVLDPNGDQVADAKVYSGGEGQPWCNSQSDEQGRFVIKGVCAGTVSLRGEHTADHILISGEIKVQAGNMNVNLVLDERRYLEPSKPTFETLIGEALPNITDLGVSKKQIDAANQQILICCFDMQQRPARRCVIQLAEQAGQLKQKGVVVVIVHVSKFDENKLKDWIKENRIPFPVGMIKDNSENVRFNWGIKSLPWLILTNKQHIVIAEGLNLDELENKIKTITEK